MPRTAASSRNRASTRKPTEVAARFLACPRPPAGHVPPRRATRYRVGRRPKRSRAPEQFRERLAVDLERRRGLAALPAELLERPGRVAAFDLVERADVAGHQLVRAAGRLQ